MTKRKTVPLKIFAIIDSYSSSILDNEIFVYKNFSPSDSTSIYKEEYEVLKHKYFKFNLEVEERLPVCSRTENFKWFICKDKYGYYTLTLVDILHFEEQFVFSLRSKIILLLHENLIMFKSKLEEHKVLLYNLIVLI